LAHNKKTKVLYVSSSALLEDYVNMSKTNTMLDFYNKYRAVDCLLIDDIQFLEKADKTQMEFFKLFEYLDNNKKQIVITCDKPTTELKMLMDRIVSRFERGSVVDLQSPDAELRVQIIKQKLKTEYNNANVPTNVIELISDNFTSSIREIEGALKRVISYCMIMNLPITKETALEALDILLKSKKKSNNILFNYYERILTGVSAYYNINIEDIVGSSRKENIVRARHVAMYLIKSEQAASYTKIGEIFGGRDHSTVLSACENIDWLLKNNELFKKEFEKVQKKISNPAKPF